MKTIDIGAMIIGYNFIIGLLLIIASEKIGVYAGHLIKSQRVQATRLTRVGTLTFGACIATLSAGIYLAGYILRL